MTKIVTRFAPSPTGFLHIGNARTAIFNYLFARHNNGEFLLRIEDTDKERSTQDAIDVIYSGLDLLGLDFDGTPVLQSERSDRHKEVVDELLASGKAYKCFCTQEELAEMRADAEKNRRTQKYNRKWRDVPENEHPDLPYTVRIKAPLDGSYTINDLVQGEITVNCKELDDMIILRADGTPVYQLAVVVDDHDMGVTHVIRGDDHLTNTFRQKMLYDAMEWDVPTFVHLPLIMDPSGKKISKRTGAASVVDYINMGYLPEAILNYLSKLGWSNEQEFLSKEELVALFDFDHVGKAASRMDPKKLNFINGHWLAKSSNDELMALVESIIPNNEKFNGIDIVDSNKNRLLALLPSTKIRVKTIVELLETVSFIDDKFWDKSELNLPDKFKSFNWKKVLLTYIDNFDNIKTNEELMGFLKEEATKYEVKLVDTAQALRFVLCKSKISPPLDAVIDCLGKNEVVRRITSIINS